TLVLAPIPCVRNRLFRFRGGVLRPAPRRHPDHGPTASPGCSLMSVFPRAHAPTRATAPPVARGRTGAGLSLARSPFPPLEVSAADFHTRSAPGVLRRSSGTPVSRRTADTLAGTHPPSAWRPPGCRASGGPPRARAWPRDRKSTRLNSSHVAISYAVFCLKK